MNVLHVQNVVKRERKEIIDLNGVKLIINFRMKNVMIRSGVKNSLRNDQMSIVYIIMKIFVNGERITLNIVRNGIEHM